MVRIKQGINEGWGSEYSLDQLIENIGIFEPIVVETQPEFDFLWSMQLMIGREFTILLLDRDENLTGYPPSFVKIDIPL